MFEEVEAERLASAQAQWGRSAMSEAVARDRVGAGGGGGGGLILALKPIVSKNI